MSRSRKRKTSPSDTPGPSRSEATPAARADSSLSSARTGIWKQVGLVVFAIAAAWEVMLILLASLTGNPVTFNRAQLRASPLVVSGTVDENGTVSHINVWKGVAPQGGIKVAPFPWPPGDYILPLQPAGRDEPLTVTRSRLPDNVPLVYPASEKSLNDLQRLLNELGR